MPKERILVRERKDKEGLWVRKKEEERGGRFTFWGERAKWAQEKALKVETSSMAAEFQVWSIHEK